MEINEKLLFEISNLVIKGYDNSLNDEEFGRLQDLLKTEPAAGEYYYELMSMFANMDVIEELETDSQKETYNDLLRQFGKHEITAPPIEIPKEQPQRELVQTVIRFPREKRKMSRFQIFTFIANTAAVLFVVLFLKFAPVEPNGIEIAKLDAAVDARWLDLTGSLKSGDSLYSSTPFALIEGLIEIQTNYGVELIIEGPAKFEFTKEGDLSLDSGKVYANVSAQGRGFTVATATSKIVDLGTEFGVQADKSGNTEVHVYKGKVTLLTGVRTMEKVTAFLLQGQARVVSSDGTVNERSVNKNLFVQKDELTANMLASQGSAYYRWRAYSYKLRRDPSLAAYYTFEKDDAQPDVLRNLAAATSDRCGGFLLSRNNHDLPAWTMGRWPEKTALKFDRSQEQMVEVSNDPALNIAGPVTLSAWINCPDFESGGGGVIVSSRTKDDINYQVSYGIHGGEARENVIAFGRYDKLRDPKIKSNKLSLTPDVWHHIVVSHDNREVKYYIDGKLYSVKPYIFENTPVETKLFLGGTEEAVVSRIFNGIMGEIAIFNRVLSAEEITAMYNASYP